VKLVPKVPNFGTCSKIGVLLRAERRKNARLNLKLPALLFWPDSDNAVRSETVNISSDGLYCIAQEPFAPGDRLRCLITLGGPFHSAQDCLYLEARIEVVRILADNAVPGFGLGCRIKDYHVVSREAAAGVDQLDPS
jgi:PilZ domain-containing protein